MAQSPGAKMLKKAMSLKTELRDKIIKRNPSSVSSTTSNSDGSFSKQHQYNTPVKKSISGDRLEVGVAKVKQALQYAQDVVQKKTIIMLPGVATVVLETVQELLQTLHYYYHTANSDEYTAQCADLYSATAELTRLSDTTVLRSGQDIDSHQILSTIKTIQENVRLLTSHCVEKSEGIPAVTPTSDRSSDASTSFMDTSNVSSDGDISMSSDSVNASPPPSKPPLPQDYELQLSKLVPIPRDSSPQPPPLPQKQGTRARSTTCPDGSVHFPVDNGESHLKPFPLQTSFDDSDLNQNRTVMVSSPSWPGSRNSREPSPMDILEKMRAEMRTDIGSTLSSMRSSASCHRSLTYNQQGLEVSHDSSQFPQQQNSTETTNSCQQIALRQNHNVDGLTNEEMINQAASSFNNQLSLAPTMTTSSLQCYSFKQQITKSRDGIEQSHSQSASHVITKHGRADVNASFVQSYVNDFAGKKEAYAFKVDVEGQDVSPNDRNCGKVTVTSQDLTDHMGMGDAIEYGENPPPLPLKKKHVDIYMLAFGGAPSTMLDFAQSQTHFQDFYRERLHQQQSELALYSNIGPIYDNNQDLDEYPEEPPPKPALPEPEPNPTYEPILEKPEEEPEDSDILLCTDVLPHITKNEEDTMEFVKAGNVEALVALAACAGNREFLYQEAFLTTYLTFIHAGDLIDKLLRRYSHFSSSQQPHSKRFSRSTFSLLIRVVDEMGALIGDEVLDDLFYLVFCLISDGELILAKCLRKTLLSKCEMKQKLLEEKRNIALLPSIQLTMRTTTLLDIKSHVIAEQMTLVDNELFQNIEISELLRYSREQREELSPNLTKFTEHFNKVSFWCRSRIMEKDDPKEREKFMVKFHKIMKHLRKLKNFHSYLALLSAVDSAPVRRLEWSKQTQDSLTELSDIIDSSSSFRKYRNTLAETQPPCIPYIGLILQDLTFVHIGNPDKAESGEVNFSKRWQLFHILEGLRRYKKQCFDIKKDSNVIMFFNGFGDHLSEEVLWQLSEDYKPRKSSKPV